MTGTTPATGIIGVVDFQGIAHLIDTVLGAEPECLPTLLRVLATSNDRLEMFVVIDIVLRCRDPLAPLSTLCHDALKAAADLDVLLTQSNWEKIDDVCKGGRANAILNLCDVTLKNANPNTTRRRRRIRTIRPKVKVCAVAETNAKRGEIERLKTTRDARLPDLWELLETSVSKDEKHRYRSRLRADTRAS